MPEGFSSGFAQVSLRLLYDLLSYGRCERAREFLSDESHSWVMPSKSSSVTFRCVEAVARARGTVQGWSPETCLVIQVWIELNWMSRFGTARSEDRRSEAELPESYSDLKLRLGRSKLASAALPSGAYCF